MSVPQDELDRLRRQVRELEDKDQARNKQMKGIEDELDMLRRRLMYQLGNLGPQNMLPTFTYDLKYYKNLVFNSSFESPGPLRKPRHWTVGICSPDAAWYSTCSLLLKPGEVSEQELLAYIPLSYYGGGPTRVSFAHKFASLKLEIVDDLNLVMYTEQVPWVKDWPQGRITFVFNPGNVLNFRLRFTNTDTVDGYIDAVQVEPDLVKHWPSLYSDGPFSEPSGAPSARMTGSAQALTASTWTTINFPTKTYDTYDQWKIAFPERIYAGADGICHIWANVGFTAVTPADPYDTFTGTFSGSVTGTADIDGNVSGSSSTTVTVPFPPRSSHVRGVRLVHGSGAVISSMLLPPSETDQTHIAISTTYQMKKDEWAYVQVYTDEAGVSTAAPLTFALTILGD